MSKNKMDALFYLKKYKLKDVPERGYAAGSWLSSETVSAQEIADLFNVAPALLEGMDQKFEAATLKHWVKIIPLKHLSVIK